MTTEIWLPAVIVLAAGLALGALLAVRLRGTGKQPRALVRSDLDLKIRDLEERRDDLYRRIRAADEDNLGPDEITALEEAAAVALMELDQLRGQLHEAPRATAEKRTDSPAPTAQEPPLQEDLQPAPASAGSGRPMLTGLVIGAGMMLVVALLIYWAGRDAHPTAPAPTQSQASDSTDEPHAAPGEIPPELAAQITDLQNRVSSDSEDWQARKQLALSYVAAGQFFEAFGEASEILKQFPNDPDGLLVHGIVRLTMGQAEQAVALLEQVLAQHPDHRQALIYRGLALYQLGQVQQALDTWEMGLEIFGGSDPELDELIQMARSNPAPTGQTPPPMPTTSIAGPTGRPAGAGDTVDPAAFAARIALAQGATAPPTASLVVFLMSPEGGPPVAARRISNPRFPIEVSLGAEDSMMGAELPETGLLVARLDSDGNVGTASPTDLESQVTASIGQRVQLTLGR